MNKNNEFEFEDLKNAGSTLSVHTGDPLAIKEMQKSLNAWGYTDAFGRKLSEDGDFGINTFNSVIKFQMDNDLVPDGIVGDKTWQAMSDRKKKEEGEIYTNPSNIDSGAVAPQSDVDSRENVNNPRKHGAFATIDKAFDTSPAKGKENTVTEDDLTEDEDDFESLKEKGSVLSVHSGSPYTIKELQKELNSMGYTDALGRKLSEDGIFGINTFNSVIKFQMDNDLVPDGVVGDKTWKAISDKKKKDDTFWFEEEKPKRNKTYDGANAELSFWKEEKRRNYPWEIKDKGFTPIKNAPDNSNQPDTPTWARNGAAGYYREMEALNQRNSVGYAMPRQYKFRTDMPGNAGLYYGKVAGSDLFANNKPENPLVLDSVFGYTKEKFNQAGEWVKGKVEDTKEWAKGKIEDTTREAATIIVDTFVGKYGFEEEEVRRFINNPDQRNIINTDYRKEQDFDNTPAKEVLIEELTEAREIAIGNGDKIAEYTANYAITDLRNFDDTSITTAYYLNDSDGASGMGHAGVLLVNESGEGVFFSFYPQDQNNLKDSASEMRINVLGKQETQSFLKNKKGYGVSTSGKYISEQYENIFQYPIKPEFGKMMFEQAVAITVAENFQYNLLEQNCEHVALSILNMGGVDIEKKHVPNLTFITEITQ